MIYGVSDILHNSVGLSSNPENLRKEEFWALEDISFEVKKGETLGIIGPNGSGKTTLLKMLNGIFWPDKGKISIRGRVGALIEVGAGFHPLLTGRENIYLNGAILGMNKQEIDKKFEAIVNFAGISDFLDSPVKFYSSGMFVRLGFAVAVHCEPDILLIDEILAVGDMKFQRKCYEKMIEFKKRRGSIVLISHNMHIIETNCDTVNFLDRGRIVKKGDVNSVLTAYYEKNSENYLALQNDQRKLGSGEIIIKNVYVVDDNGAPKDVFLPNDKLKILIEYEIKQNVATCNFGISFWKNNNIKIATLNTAFEGGATELGRRIGKVECNIEVLPFLPACYAIRAGIYDKDNKMPYSLWGWQKLETSILILPSPKGNLLLKEALGLVYLEGKWQTVD